MTLDFCLRLGKKLGLVCAALFAFSTGHAQIAISGDSETVTLNCVGSPCPWGGSPSGLAVVWPDTVDPLRNRLGYEASAGAYLTAPYANGATIWIDSGSARVYAGHPDASSHRRLATLNAGGQTTVSGLAPGEVLSIQGSGSFSYHADLTDPSSSPPPGSGSPSELVTLNCTAAQCPWGASIAGQAVVWPSSLAPIVHRLGYTANAGAYLPSFYANQSSVTVESGSANVYAGRPRSASHRRLATLNAGQTLNVSGLATGEVLSVYSFNSFTYHVDLPDPGPTPDGTLHDSVRAYFRCDTPGCNRPDIEGAVIDWPDWSAYPNNARSGDVSKTVYSEAGGLLYPYMGPWADGCEATVKSGITLLIEWERGTNVWRQTVLGPGDSYTINLISPEDGALFESEGSTPGFSVYLDNCEPQPLP